MGNFIKYVGIIAVLIVVLFLASILLMTIAVSFSDAQERTAVPCLPREKMIEHLKPFKEEQTAAGINDSGNMIEILSSKIGTWSLIITKPDGISCLVDTGTSWAQDVPKKEGSPI